jgi:hypothetical protein
MKSEYRCLVEMIISDERKLAEATKLHAEALERFQKAAEILVTVEKRLEAKRAELGRISELLDNTRPSGGGSKPADKAQGCAAPLLGEVGRVDRLESEVDDLRRSFKMIAGWYLGDIPIKD